MGHTTWVLVNKARLPKPGSLTNLAGKAGWPLEVDGSFDWERHAGFLPMRWSGVQTGCEVALLSLPEEESARAQQAGYQDLDAVVEVTHRGWDGLRAASAFMAVVASATKGAISEEDGKLVGSRNAKRWANADIAAAEEAQAREARRERALAALDPNGLGGALDAAVAAMSGEVVDKAVMLLDHLLFRVRNGHSVSGASWRLISPSGQVLNQDSALGAANELQRWPGKPVIARAQRVGTTVRIEFDSPEGGVVEFHAGRDFRSEVSVRTPDVTLELRGEEITAR